jgi:hypothetical protein
MAQAYQAIGLTSAEVQILAKAQKKRDYYYRSVKGRRLFELGLGPAALALVGASSQHDQAFLDELVATRDPRDYARALFERRGVAWTEPGAIVAPTLAATSPVDDAQTVPMTEDALAELLSSDDSDTDPLDSDEATTVPCPPPEPEPTRNLVWRKRAP